MTTEIIERPSSIELPVPLDQVRRLELLAQDCSRQSLAALGPIERALTVASGMQLIEAAISSEMMRCVLPLMNSRLGFLTDRDPARNKKEKVPAYEESVVKRCLIESLFHGLYPVNNEWNIIASSCYAAKNGLRRKIDEFPCIAEFRRVSQVPVMNRDCARVVVAASWKLNGVADSVEAEVPIRYDDYSSMDQIQGKATRKLYAIVWEALVGSPAASLLPTGDVDEIGQQRTIGVSSSPGAVAAPPGPVDAAAFSQPKSAAGGRQQAAGSDARLSELKTVEQLLQRAEFLGVSRGQVAHYFQLPFDKLGGQELDELRRLLFEVQHKAKTWDQAVEAMK